MQDIQHRQDLQKMVTHFYDKLAHSERIKHIFFDRLGEGDWSPHLNRIVDFWDTVLFSTNTYIGQSFAPHASMNLHQEDFDEWLLLFCETVDELFAGPVAEDAKKRAKVMAVLFMSKIAHNREHGGTSIV